MKSDFCDWLHSFSIMCARAICIIAMCVSFYRVCLDVVSMGERCFTVLIIMDLFLLN